METVVKLLRPEDVLAHCYHGTGYTILDNNGKVLPAVREAQKRGVIIDAANVQQVEYTQFHYIFNSSEESYS